MLMSTIATPNGHARNASSRSPFGSTRRTDAKHPPDPSVRSLDREALVALAKSERAEIAQHQGRLSNLQERLEGAETTNASRWILLPVGADRASATPLKTRSNPSTTVVNGHSASTRPCLWEISPRRPKPDRPGWPDFERSARGLPSWIRSNVKFLMRPTATKARRTDQSRSGRTQSDRSGSGRRTATV